MPNYSSFLYKSLSIFLGIFTFFFVYSLFEEVFFSLISGVVVFLIYFWFGQVLYGLENNGTILMEISKKLGKDLPYDNETFSHEDAIEETSEEKLKIETKTDDVKDKITNNSEQYLEKNEMSKKEISAVIIIPIAIVVYLLLIYFLEEY